MSSETNYVVGSFPSLESSGYQMGNIATEEADLSIKARVKICCIQNRAELELALKYGANALGFVGPMPSGPGILKVSEIKELLPLVPSNVRSYLLTSATDAETIIEQHRKLPTTTLQLTDSVNLRTYKILRKALKSVRLVQVVHVTDSKIINHAVALSKHVDAILLDSGNPNKAVKELGGTGRTHNWAVSRAIRDKVTVPVFLAGGLNPENIQIAINTVQPFGVDVCSGLRDENSALVESKLHEFMTAVTQTAIPR